MLMLKLCHACDRILGEVEVDDLTREYDNSIMEVVGNVAYAYCPECLEAMRVEEPGRLH